MIRASSSTCPYSCGCWLRSTTTAACARPATSPAFRTGMHGASSRTPMASSACRSSTSRVAKARPSPRSASAWCGPIAGSPLACRRSSMALRRSWPPSSSARASMRAARCAFTPATATRSLPCAISWRHAISPSNCGSARASMPTPRWSKASATSRGSTSRPAHCSPRRWRHSCGCSSHARKRSSASSRAGRA